MADVKNITSLSKISSNRKADVQPSIRSGKSIEGNSSNRLKKMVSLDTFESQV